MCRAGGVQPVPLFLQGRGNLSVPSMQIVDGGSRGLAPC